MKDSTKKAAQDLLADPLSSVTRSSKKSLLIFASLCFLISYTGVMPEEASILGFKFPGLTPRVIQTALVVLLIHSYLSFLAHAISDYLRLRILMDRYNFALAIEADDAMSPPNEDADRDADEFRYNTGYTEKEISPKSTKITNYAKLILDFVFPVAYGLFSLIYYFFKLR